MEVLEFDHLIEPLKENFAGIIIAVLPMQVQSFVYQIHVYSLPAVTDRQKAASKEKG